MDGSFAITHHLSPFVFPVFYPKKMQKTIYDKDSFQNKKNKFALFFLLIILVPAQYFDVLINEKDNVNEERNFVVIFQCRHYCHSKTVNEIECQQSNCI